MATTNKNITHLLALLALCLLIVPPVSAQKYVKHKLKFSKFVWYEIKYPDGSVGISVDDKKNIIVTGEKGYSSIEYFDGRFSVKKGHLAGIIDLQGNEIIAPNKFNAIKLKSEYSYLNHYKYYEVGIGVLAYSPEYVGICNFAGEEVIPCVYKSVQIYNRSIRMGNKSQVSYYFSIKGDSTSSICDTIGNILFPPSDYDWVYPHLTRTPTSYDLASNIVGFEVRKNGKYGICSGDGEELLAPAYESVRIDDSHGRPLVVFKENGKEGVSDVYGNIIIAPKYDNIYLSYTDGHSYFSIEKNKKRGICDASGTEIIPPVFDETIFWSGGEYRTKRDGNYIAINISDFNNPEQRIKAQGELRVLADANGVFSARAYDVLEWDENSNMYIGALQGYTTLIDVLGKEENSIAKQIFEEAYNLSDAKVYEKMLLYNMVIEIDANNKEGYQALALNNIGVIYGNDGDDATALNYYDKAAAMGNSKAAANAAQIRKEQRAAARAERLQRLSDALGELNNALSAYSSGTQYGSSSNIGSSNQIQQVSSSGGNGQARQSAYDHMANRAANLYSSLTNKNGYVGGERIYRVELSTYNKLRRDMRNYRLQAQRDGITLQKSQYEDLAL